MDGSFQNQLWIFFQEKDFQNIISYLVCVHACSNFNISPFMKNILGFDIRNSGWSENYW